MSSQLSSSRTSPEAHGSRWSWLLPGGTFLAGCALGAVVMGVADAGGDAGPSTSAGSAAAPAGAGSSAEAGGAGDDGLADSGDSSEDVRVPGPCVQTADEATRLVEQVDRVVAGIADLEPERLRQSVDDVQQIRDEVRDVADQCRAAAAERLRDAADAEGDGTAPPTPSS
jgi:hypothetical protein